MLESFCTPQRIINQSFINNLCFEKYGRYKYGTDMDKGPSKYKMSVLNTNIWNRHITKMIHYLLRNYFYSRYYWWSMKIKGKRLFREFPKFSGNTISRSRFPKVKKCREFGNPIFKYLLWTIDGPPLFHEIPVPSYCLRRCTKCYIYLILGTNYLNKKTLLCKVQVIRV